MTVGEAIDRYIDSRAAVLSPATVRGYRTIRRNGLRLIMDETVAALTEQAVQVAISADAERLSPKSVRNEGGLLLAALEAVRPDLRLDIRYPQPKPSDIQIPTEDEVDAMIRAAEGTPMHLPVLLAARCGLRRSEIAALLWSDIDTDAGVLRVRRAEVLGDDGTVHTKPPKSVTSARTILMPDEVADALIAARVTSVSDRVAPVRVPQDITNGFDDILRAAGVRHYRFHDLRHYLVSVMLAANVPKKYIADYVGHSTEDMIDRVYGHIMSAKKAEVQEAVKAYFDGEKKRKQKQEK